MRRDGLHFLIPDPTGPIDVADLRRNPNLPTSLVLGASDHAVQAWSTDYDLFCGPAGPVGTAIGDAGPFVLRLSGVPTAARLWEMPLLALHWAFAASVRQVGRDSARTVVWILGALDHRGDTPLADLAPTLAGSDPISLVEASLPRLREDAEAGRVVIGLVARGEGAEAAVARLAEALPATCHRFAVFDRFAEVTAVLDEPTLPILAANTMPVPESPPVEAAAPVGPPAPRRRPMRAVAAAAALLAVAGAGVLAQRHLQPARDASPPIAEAVTPATVASQPAAVLSAVPTQAPAAQDGEPARPAATTPPLPAAPDPVTTGATGATAILPRSEERRVGKECRRLCRSRWAPYH
jgi:hypothetical protein